MLLMIFAVLIGTSVATKDSWHTGRGFETSKYIHDIMRP
jgi:hypothetical protein